LRAKNETSGEIESVTHSPDLPFEHDPSAVGPYLGREWLETNGLGSYASSSISGANTRRYHGLLVAALDPPLRRYVLLSRVEETLVVSGRDGDRSYPLSTSVYRGAVSPEGYRSIVSFEPRPVATWHFSAGGVELERRVWMPHGRQAVAICYRVLRAPEGVSLGLEVRPLVAYRGFHDLASENRSLDRATTVERGRVSIQPYASLPWLYLHHDAETFVEEPLWYRSFEYGAELERGFPAWEDLFTHGRFLYRLDATEAGSAFLFASLDRIDRLTADELRALEKLDLSRREERAARAARARAARQPDRWSEAFASRLAEAAEQFLVSRANGRRSVIAGYHWFEDWGRDTFISLPGLALATGRWPLAYELLRTFAAYVDRGMVPNRFPDSSGEPEYGSADAALWFVEAARRYAHDASDLSFIGREVFPRIREIVDWYTRGTRHGIGVDPADGLLAASAEGRALTWMDAAVDGRPVTPRAGKPVELNALWHNALSSAAEMAEALGFAAEAGAWREAAGRARESFNARFWNPATGCLYDVVDGPDGDDASIRPNQIFAVSLPYAPLRVLRHEAVVDAVDRRLVTPMGLRTLDPDDPRYRGRYEGGPAERDEAYHNGTVWPWLLGPFVTAYLKAHGRTPETLARVRGLVQPFARHLGMEGCIGQVSEIADGDPPHAPRGCVAQAWNVAELARLVLEEIR
jgi:predicted glycogen debranching enzyme